MSTDSECEAVLRGPVLLRFIGGKVLAARTHEFSEGVTQCQTLAGSSSPVARLGLARTTGAQWATAALPTLTRAQQDPKVPTADRRRLAKAVRTISGGGKVTDVEGCRLFGVLATALKPGQGKHVITSTIPKGRLWAAQSQACSEGRYTSVLVESFSPPDSPDGVLSQVRKVLDEQHPGRLTS